MGKRTSARAERDRRIFELRARGWTQKAIAAEVGCAQTTVSSALNPAQAERMRAQIRTDEARAERDKRIYELRAMGWKRNVIAAEVGCCQKTVADTLAGTATEREYRQAKADRSRERRLERRRADAAWKAEYDRAYRAANADRIRGYRDRKREQQRRYWAENAEKISERRREQYAANAEEINAQRRATYGDRERERLGRYRRANLEAHRAVHARRKIRASVGMDAIDRLLAVEYRKAIVDDPCTYCGAPGEHDDHKFPLARGGTDHWWNLHRTCRECNQRKHLMTHQEFLASGKVSRAVAS